MADVVSTGRDMGRCENRLEAESSRGLVVTGNMLLAWQMVLGKPLGSLVAELL